MRDGLHPNERRIFEMGGKPYTWVRVNGQLQLRTVLDDDGKLNALGLQRLAGE